MKKIVIVNGSMGIGKTSTCVKLYKKMDNTIWLDGDWSWMMHPWKLKEIILDMVFDNITYSLRNFMACDQYDTILFNWVLHSEEWLKRLVEGLGTHDYQVQIITLICTEQALKERLMADHRSEQVTTHALERLPLYAALPTEQLDTTCLSVDEVVRRLYDMIQE
jgi:hypothetical protein